jgi:hypothetical protein
MTAEMARVIKTAGQKLRPDPMLIVGLSPGTGCRSCPFRSSEYVYAAYSAWAPVAKLSTPDERYVTTSATAKAANTPPFPSPSRKNWK